MIYVNLEKQLQPKSESNSYRAKVTVRHMNSWKPEQTTSVGCAEALLSTEQPAKLLTMASLQVTYRFEYRLVGQLRNRIP